MVRAQLLQSIPSTFHCTFSIVIPFLIVANSVAKIQINITQASQVNHDLIHPVAKAQISLPGEIQL